MTISARNPRNLRIPFACATGLGLVLLAATLEGEPQIPASHPIESKTPIIERVNAETDNRILTACPEISDNEFVSVNNDFVDLKTHPDFQIKDYNTIEGKIKYFKDDEKFFLQQLQYMRAYKSHEAFISIINSPVVLSIQLCLYQNAMITTQGHFITSTKDT